VERNDVVGIWPRLFLLQNVVDRCFLASVVGLFLSPGLLHHFEDPQDNEKIPIRACRLPESPHLIVYYTFIHSNTHPIEIYLTY
jgi:hypothetical protein